MYYIVQSTLDIPFCQYVCSTLESAIERRNYLLLAKTTLTKHDDYHYSVTDKKGNKGNIYIIPIHNVY